MHMRNILGLVLLVAIVMSSGVVGCKRKPKSGGLGSGGVDGVLPPLDGGGYGELTNPDQLETVASQFQHVYFEYDSSQVAGSERAKLEDVADYLRGNSGVGLVVEGHCDERGSSDYNLALGERRAQAVRAYIIGLGIASERIKTISHGEEQPLSFGHDEASWSQNRRAQFSLFQ